MPTANSYSLEMEIIRRRTNNELLSNSNNQLLQEKADAINELRSLQIQNSHLKKKFMDLDQTVKSVAENAEMILSSYKNILKCITDENFVFPENELPNTEINHEHSSSVQAPETNGAITLPVVIRDLQIPLTDILNHVGMQFLNNTTKNDDAQSECSNANEEPTNSASKATNQETKENLIYKKGRNGTKNKAKSKNSTKRKSWKSSK